MSIYEARSDGNSIKLNGWVRWVAGIILTGVMAMNAYAYYVVFPKTVENIVENDKNSRERDMKLKDMVYENKVAIQAVVAMKEDLVEIKSLLRRAAPYELRGDK